MTEKKRIIKEDFSEVLGKVPPQAVEAEEMVLGAMLLESNCVEDVITVIPNGQCFYKETNATIFDAILELYRDNKPIDLITVTDQLRKNGRLDFVGGPNYVTELTIRISSAANVEFHSRIILEKYFLRRIIEHSSRSSNSAFEEKDPFEIMDGLYSALVNLTDMVTGKKKLSMHQLLKQNLDKIDDTKNIPDHVTGVHSGFKKLDKITAGWQDTDFIILAARPGMGKTALALSFARTAAVDFGLEVLYFSLEMADAQLVLRLQSAEAEIELERLKRADINDSEIETLVNKSGNLDIDNLVIEDEPGINVMRLKAKCHKHKKDRGALHLIIVDYLQLMSGDDKSSNREQEISYISRNLKAAAKDLGVPVIALSQLSRAVETRGGDKKPQLSDLRESGSLEQDADMVMFLYRPEYYGIIEDHNGIPTLGVAQLIIAKNRQGALETVWMKFVAKFTTFKDLDMVDRVPRVEGYSNKLHEAYKVKSVDKEDYEEETDDLPF